MPGADLSRVSMSADEQDKKRSAIEAIRFNTRMYNLTALVVVFTLLLIIVNSVTPLASYIPKYSIVTLLTIVAMLVVINYWLSKRVATHAIQNMEEYEEKVSALLNAMDKEIKLRRTSREELESLSFRDELTGLHNRHGFIPLAEHYIKTLDRGRSAAYIVYADIDNMKLINDMYGHQEGDTVIKKTAGILNEAFNGSSIIARISDDEFAVFPAELQGSDGGMINERLWKEISEVNAAGGRGYSISISWGIAEYDPADPCSLDELLSRSEELMYEQKRKKKQAVSHN